MISVIWRVERSYGLLGIVAYQLIYRSSYIVFTLCAFWSVQLLKTNISQCSVAQCLTCGEISKDHFVANIANFPLSVTVNEFNIWRRTRQKYGGLFFTNGVHYKTQIFV